MAIPARVGSRRSRLVFAVSVYAALIALTVVFLFPLVWIIGLSLKTRLQIFAMPPVLIWWPTFQNYASTLSSGDFFLCFWNSLVVATGAVLLSLCVGVPAAYAIARFPFRGRSVLFFGLVALA